MINLFSPGVIVHKTIIPFFKRIKMHTRGKKNGSDYYPGPEHIRKTWRIYGRKYFRAAVFGLCLYGLRPVHGRADR